MSHFYAEIQGIRSRSTRCGCKEISGHIRGWGVGIQVFGKIEKGKDVFYVYRTSGSSATHPPVLIAKIIE